MFIYQFILFYVCHEYFRHICQQILDDEQRSRHSQREELAASERRNAVLAGEIEELRSQIDVLEKTRKMTESELHEISDRVADLTNANSALLAAKKKTEVELQSLHVRQKFYFKLKDCYFDNITSDNNVVIL